MENFDGITFRGKFRVYQQRVLDSASKYFKDGKINIVAAPGSGKTILGLELIRRLNSPCLILSPTTTIKQQWGDRFEEMFLDEKQNVKDFVSYDLHNVLLLTSITYQALHSAMNKVACKNDEEVVDNSNIDIFKLIKENKIKTICLDESHHLQNEWQKALEKFIEMLDKKVKIISLTATPPYDASMGEWQRYTSVCGEIDEEIGVPELVKQKNLCPHQDFVYFNYPTEEETASLLKYREKAKKSIDQICSLTCFADIYQNAINAINDNDSRLITFQDEYLALLSLFQYAKYEVDPKMINKISKKGILPDFNLEQAQTAIQFILELDLATEENKFEIIQVLKSHALFTDNKVSLLLNDKLKKKLVSSIGKLKSIEKIVLSEIENFADGLRMLVLTDFIRKETLKYVGTEDEFDEISIVSIFETIRRITQIDIGVVSGSLFVLPNKMDEYLTEKSIDFKKKELKNTNYSVFELKCSNNDKVKLASDIFEKGLVKILVGTKSLLGEGWDSPCINSLILASFVGSFMLSNQMRGRAIRIDKKVPDKISNIWHLVTIEPDFNLTDKSKQDTTQIHSNDYDMLKRRFDCFVGPNYNSKIIENGIDRLETIKGPYDEEGIKNINNQMLALAKDKKALVSSWEAAVQKSDQMHVESAVPKTSHMKKAFGWKNMSLIICFLVIELLLVGGLITTFIVVSIKHFDTLAFILFLILVIIGSVAIFYTGKKLRARINPKNAIRTFAEAILKTYQKTETIRKSVKVITIDDEKESSVRVFLKGGNRKEQDVFNTAIAELLAPIENPKYLIIKKSGSMFNYIYSFSCPNSLSKHKSTAEILRKELANSSGDYYLVNTRNETGKVRLGKAKKYSYVMHNKLDIKKRQRNI